MDAGTSPVKELQVTDGLLNAVIVDRIDVAPGVWIVYVAPDGWALPDFEPGQYATLGLPATLPRCDGGVDEEDLAGSDGLIKRDYSIASSPREKNHLEFYLVMVDEGGLTPRLYGLGRGDRVRVEPAFAGTFVLSRVPADANIILVATGTGIAPYVSMLRTVLHRETKRWIALFHGARHSSDFGYREEFASMARLTTQFSYFPTVSRPAEETVPWPGRVGYVQDIWRSNAVVGEWKRAPTPENTHVFLCGSPAMIDDMILLLGESGFSEWTETNNGHIHVERYW